MKIFSFDAETNGLWGKPFAIGAIVYDGGTEIDRFVARCPIDGVIDQWVSDNVFPEMVDVPESHMSYSEMLGDFASFYLGHKHNATVIAYVAVPVESSLIRDMHSMGFIGDWDAPFPLIDVAGMLHLAGEDAVSVDDYTRKHGISVNSKDFSGGAHNPLYDSAQAAAVYSHLMKGPKKRRSFEG